MKKGVLSIISDMSDVDIWKRQEHVRNHRVATLKQEKALYLTISAVYKFSGN